MDDDDGDYAPEDDAEDTDDHPEAEVGERMCCVVLLCCVVYCVVCCVCVCVYVCMCVRVVVDLHLFLHQSCAGTCALRTHNTAITTSQHNTTTQHIIVLQYNRLQEAQHT